MDKTQKIEIGQRIKWLRDNSAETSRTIAAHCDVSVEAVRNWLAGKGIAYDNAVKVADLFEIDVDWVWRGRGKGPKSVQRQDPILNLLHGDGEQETVELSQLDRVEIIIRAIADHLKIPVDTLPAPPAELLEPEPASDRPSHSAAKRSDSGRRS